ncbi:MAG: hypothetical protein C0407_01900 [Desulfobacca sp.]|nr:hypothetical protein [Desulfobacca sp.]
MAGVIDTNILLYGVNGEAEEHRAALAFLHRTAASGEPWFLTEGICYEFLRVATHPKVFTQPLTYKEALRFLQPFWRSSSFEILVAGEDHWNLLQEITKETTHPSGNLFFDIRTVTLMREHGIREIYTSDTDFLQFKGITVIHPLR